MEPTSIRLKPSLTQPLPGSLTAFLAGCRCPREINRHGLGAGLFGTAAARIPYYHVHPHCPLHMEWERYCHTLDEEVNESPLAPQGGVQPPGASGGASGNVAVPKRDWRTRLRTFFRRLRRDV